MRHEARQVPSWLIFDVRQYPILGGQRRFEMRSVLRPCKFAAGRAKSSTPAIATSFSKTRIGVREFEHLGLILRSETEGGAEVEVAIGALRT